MSLAGPLLIVPEASLTLSDLDIWAKDVISKGALPGSAAFANAINTSIVVHFLGFDWYDRQASLNSPSTSFLHPHFDGDGKARVWSMHFLNLAEMLFNLQSVENFSTVLPRLKDNQIESTLCELQIGMLLKQEGLVFRYIDQTDVDEKVPDVELTLWDGASARGEIKCKYEDEADLSEEAFAGALNKARRKFKSDESGLIFVKVPQAWAVQTLDMSVKLPPEASRATARFLRNNSRIAKIVYYDFHLTTRLDGSVLNQHALHEVANPKNAPGSPWNRTLLRAVPANTWVALPALVERWGTAHARGIM
jgi:hypothetical protein